MSRANVRLDALTLELRDDPARRYHAANAILSSIALLVALLAILVAVGAAITAPDFNGMLSVLRYYAWAFGFGFISALTYTAANWCDTHRPPTDLPLTERDRAIVAAHLNRYQAAAHYQRVVEREGRPTYRTIRDVVTDACMDAYEARLPR